MPNKETQTDLIEHDLNRLAVELERLNANRFIRVQNSMPRLIGYQFLRGLAFGFGTAIGAGALVSLVAVLLSQIEVVPFVGEFATQIIEEIQREDGAITR